MDIASKSLTPPALAGCSIAGCMDITAKAVGSWLTLTAFLFSGLGAANLKAARLDEIEKVTVAVSPGRVPTAASLYLPALTQKPEPSLASTDLLHETRRYLSGYYRDSHWVEPAIGNQIVCRDRAAALVAFLRKRGADARLVYGDYGQRTALFGSGAHPGEGHSWVHLILPTGATWVVDPTFHTMEEWLPGQAHPLVDKPFYGLYCIEFGTGEGGRLIETTFRVPHRNAIASAVRNGPRIVTALHRPIHKSNALASRWAVAAR